MRIPQFLLRFVRKRLGEEEFERQRGRARIHYWEVPSSTGKSLYAYVKVKASGNVELGTSAKRSIA